jgi:hypothetical protein
MIMRRILLCAVLTLFVLSAGWEGYMFVVTRQPLHAKMTETRMMGLMQMLEGEAPTRLDPESLKPLLARWNCAECLKDDWGRPLVIERTEEHVAHCTRLLL